MPPEIVALAGFAVVMALGQFSPGPDMLWLTRVALRDGSHAGVFTAIGIACGLAVHATLALSGLALLLHRSPSLKIAFTLAAAAYLGWLAIRIIREPATALDSNSTPSATHRPFLRGLLCNLANPKAALFIAAICTPFLESATAPWFAAALWAIIVFQGGILWALWAIVLQTRRARAIYQNHARRIDVAFASALAVIAIWLLVGLGGNAGWLVRL
jgi:threonine/homoserine/homoserine lactone efflux protein